VDKRWNSRGLRAVKVTKVADTNSFQNVHSVEAKKIYDTENAEAIHMCLAPGQSLKKHTTPVDVFFYILEGKGYVEIGDEKQEVEKDMLIDSPKGIPHLLRNSGNSVFRFLVVKVPKQKEKTRVHS
jgi:mannose-6-phosphate isomerase-like protein (cupin superfamily)